MRSQCRYCTATIPFTIPFTMPLAMPLTMPSHRPSHTVNNAATTPLQVHLDDVEEAHGARAIFDLRERQRRGQAQGQRGLGELRHAAEVDAVEPCGQEVGMARPRARGGVQVDALAYTVKARSKPVKSATFGGV